MEFIEKCLKNILNSKLIYKDGMFIVSYNNFPYDQEDKIIFRGKTLEELNNNIRNWGEG